MTPQAILITGATSGIGRVAALDLVRRGHHVFATGRNRTALEALALEAKHLGRCDVVELDVTSSPSVDAAAQFVLEHTQGRGLDVLINNAGYATAAPMIELSDDALRAQFETNVFGLMRVTRVFAEAMIRRKRGRILNVSSVSGRIPAPMLGAYHASKYALEALSDALRMELAPFGVGVTIIEPGTIRTEFAERTLAEARDAKRGETRYGAIYARQAELAARFDKMATGPQVVSDAIVRAVESRKAPIRIVAPGRFALLIALVNALPTAWVDAAMGRVSGLTSLPT